MATSLKAHTKTALKVPNCLAAIMAFGLLAWPMAGLAQDVFLSTRQTPRQAYWQVQELTPKSAGGQGELEAPDLTPDYPVIMAGINYSWALEPEAADAIFAGVEAVAKLTHLQKPEARIILQSILPTLDPAKNRGS